MMSLDIHILETVIRRASTINAELELITDAEYPTQEFFGMPNDAMAFVEGKSSIGRTGLIVATATQVAPGFHGCIVLELANTGTVPLQIRPGMPIAQLVVIGTSEPVSSDLLYGGDYDCQIRP